MRSIGTEEIAAKLKRVLDGGTTGTRRTCRLRLTIEPIRVGYWIFWTLKGGVDAGMMESLAAIVDRQPYSKHPQTVPFAWPPERTTKSIFSESVSSHAAARRSLKIYCARPRRASFWRQGMSLSAAGFNVPQTVVFGEKRRWGLPERSLVLTRKNRRSARASIFSRHWLRSRETRAQIQNESAAPCPNLVSWCVDFMTWVSFMAISWRRTFSSRGRVR